jgi:uncharacterized protein DUF6889
VTLLRMAEDEDWVFRPMDAGFCTYAELVHGTTLDLADVARMNDAIDVREENSQRLRDHYREHPEG